MGKFLDDKFYLFDNAMKAQICLACASVYKIVSYFDDIFEILI